MFNEPVRFVFSSHGKKRVRNRNKELAWFTPTPLLFVKLNLAYSLHDRTIRLSSLLDCLVTINQLTSFLWTESIWIVFPTNNIHVGQSLDDQGLQPSTGPYIFVSIRLPPHALEAHCQQNLHRERPSSCPCLNMYLTWSPWLNVQRNPTSKCHLVFIRLSGLVKVSFEKYQS